MRATITSYISVLLSFVLLSPSLSAQRVWPSDKHISYEGRVIVDKDAAQLMWPGTSVTLSFVGTAVSAVIREADSANYYNIILDGDSIRKIHFDTVKRTYVLAENLRYGTHSVQLFKRTEWDKGKTWFYGFVLDGKTKLLQPGTRPRRRIEFYGNSISCGYALEDRTGDSWAGYYENNYEAYPAITARHFGAQYQCIAKSGIGIMVSWFPLIMPEMFDRTDPADALSKWDFSKYVPDVVVINLLQNDSWLVNKPDHEQFKNRFGTRPPTEDSIVRAYKNFVETIRTKYPRAQIICMLGNMDITRKGSSWPGYVQKAAGLLNDKKVFTLFVPYKETPGHPKAAEQKALAQSLIDFIDKHIHW